jgi:hypothetical protein
MTNITFPDVMSPGGIDSAPREQLIQSGIGDRFLSTNVSGFGEIGKTWVKNLNDHSPAVRKLLKRGMLVFITGKQAREFAHSLAANFLFAYGADVKSLHLSTLSDLLDNHVALAGSDYFEEIYDSGFLVVTEFLNTWSSCPLSPRSVSRVEDYLLQRMSQAGKTTFLVGEGDVSDLSSWWSPAITTRVEDNFLIQKVDKYHA